MLGRALARQLSRPEGVLGRIVARLMNRFNRDMSRMAIAAMEVARGDDVLEIGFGGGASLDPLLVAAGTGKVTGLDLSETMVLRAQRRFAWAVREGRLQVRLGQVEHLPFAGESFDRVLTSNTIYFWADARRALAEIFRVLRPCGRLSLAFSPRSVLERGRLHPPGFILRDEAEVLQLVKGAGFVVGRVDRHEHPARGFVIIAADKPGRAG